jgi:hypothetical protein
VQIARQPWSRRNALHQEKLNERVTAAGNKKPPKGGIISKAKNQISEETW